MYQDTNKFKMSVTVKAARCPVMSEIGDHSNQPTRM